MMKTNKINLKEFKKESLHIKNLLEAKGGSGSDCNTGSYSVSRSCGNDTDCNRGDCDY